MKRIPNISIFNMLLLLLIGYTFVACSSEDPEVVAFDQEAPHLVSVFPAENTKGVPVRTSVSMNFDEAMYPSTINFNIKDTACSGSVQLSRDEFNSCVPMLSASFSYSADKKSFSVSPQNALDGFQKYKIKITTGAKDLALNPLEKEFVMTSGFETGVGEVAPNQAQAIRFEDENTKEFEITGTVYIERATDESELSGYILYWGAGPSQKLVGEGSIQTYLVTDGTLQHTFSQQAIPAYATHFLVYSTTLQGELATPTSLDIPDTVLKMAVNICPGEASSDSNPKHMMVYNGKLFFSANGCNGHGEELWATYGDGNAFLAADITDVSSDSSFPGEKVVYKEKLYFPAQKAATDGIELWEYNDFSTPPTHNMVNHSQIYPSGSAAPGDLTVFGDVLFFRARDAAGDELRYFDGVNPVGVIDINGSGDSSADGMTEYNNRLYFAANDGSGNSIWSYDGMVPSPSSPTNYNELPNSPAIPVLPLGAEFYQFDNRLYFRADDGTNGVELWYYDGSGINILANIFSGGASSHSEPKWFTEYNKRLFFQARDTSTDIDLWMYDGMNYPQRVLSGMEEYSEPAELIVYKGKLIFRAYSSTTGWELWGYIDSDDPAYPFTIGDINPGTGSSMPSFFTEYNGRLYFAANDGINGNELWVFYIE